MVADGLHREAADRPQGKGEQRDEAERTPAPRIKRFLGKARRHEAGNINLLPVGIAASAVERRKRMGTLGLSATCSTPS